VVSTHLKNISQIGSFPHGFWVTIKNASNHQPATKGPAASNPKASPTRQPVNDFNPTDPDLQGAFRDQELATVQGCHRDNTTTAEGKMLHLWMLWSAMALWCWDNAAYGKTNRVFVKHIARCIHK